MPDLLLLSSNTKTHFAIEAAAKQQGYRVKASADPLTAREWLQLRSFDVVVFDHEVEAATQSELSVLLWRQNPAASLIIVNLESTDASAWPEARLFGAELIEGENAVAQLVQMLGDIAKRNLVARPTELQILVVEDLDSPRDIICFYIESLGLGRVIGVNSAAAALEQLDSMPLETTCVITDIRMPRVTGKDLIDSMRLNKKFQHLPVIVLTAYGTVDTLIDCLKAGASGFLVKPPKRDDLVREVGRALRIIQNHTSPRLASHNEAEMLRDLLVQKGFS